MWRRFIIKGMMDIKSTAIQKTLNKHPYLVGGFNPFEKYESQLGWLFPIYVKKMFQTTNQLTISDIGSWNLIFFPQVRPHFPNNLVWVNFITTSLRPSPGIMVNKRNHPQMALIHVGQGPQEVGGLNSGEWIIIIYPDLVMSYKRQQKRVLHAVCHWSLKNGGFPLCPPTKGSAVCLETIPPISWDKFMTLSWNGICVFSNVFKYQSHILFVHHPCFFGPPGLWHEELHAAPDMVHETTPFTTDLKGEEPLRLGGGYPVGTWEIRPFLTLRDCALAKLKSKS